METIKKKLCVLLTGTTLSVVGLGSMAGMDGCEAGLDAFVTGFEIGAGLTGGDDFFGSDDAFAPEFVDGESGPPYFDGLNLRV